MFIKDDIPNNKTQLIKILFNILTKICQDNKHIKTKREYKKILM